MSRVIEGRETLYDGFYRLDRLVLRDEGAGDTYTREVFARGLSACVLIHDPARDLVLLVEEWRVGNAAAGHGAPGHASIGPVAGMVDPGETALEAALREAREEAGIEVPAERIIGPRSTFTSPGSSSEIAHQFIAQTDLSGARDGAVHGVRSEGEETIVRVMPRAKAQAHVYGGTANGFATTCLRWLETLILKGDIPLEIEMPMEGNTT